MNQPTCSWVLMSAVAIWSSACARDSSTGGLDAATGGLDAAAGGTSGGSGGSGGGGASGSAPRPLGTVTGAMPGSADGPCPSGALCTTMTVICPGIDNLQAVVAVTQPAGNAKGTIFVHGGGGGDMFYGANVDEYVSGGFRVAQVRWISDWEQTTTKGIKVAACRPATALQWVFENVHGRDRTSGYCAVGFSGGSGALSYSLAHYGAEAILDYVALAAGPPFGRLDYGCAPSTYMGPPRALCPELADAPIALPAAKIDAWANTTTCGDASPAASDLAKWAEDSVVSPGADYDYAQTVVSFWDCATNPNGTTGGAYFYSREIVSTRSVTCPTTCSGENLGTAGFAVQLEAMRSGCVPRP